MDITSPFVVVPVIVAVFRHLHSVGYQQQRRRALSALTHRETRLSDPQITAGAPAPFPVAESIIQYWRRPCFTATR